MCAVKQFIDVIDLIEIPCRTQCYLGNRSNINGGEFPTLSFYFEGGLSVRLPPHFLFEEDPTGGLIMLNIRETYLRDDGSVARHDRV